MFKALFNKKGMTLTEILVGSIMLALFSIGITAVISPMISSFLRANDFSEYNAFLDAVGNRIVTDFVRSTDAPVIVNNDMQPSLTLKVGGLEDIVYNIHNTDGTLLRNSEPVFPEGFYRGKQIGFNVVEHDDIEGCYILTVRVRARANSNRLISSNADQPRVFYVRPLALINDIDDDD